MKKLLMMTLCLLMTTGRVFAESIPPRDTPVTLMSTEKIQLSALNVGDTLALKVKENVYGPDAQTILIPRGAVSTIVVQAKHRKDLLLRAESLSLTAGQTVRLSGSTRLKSHKAVSGKKVAMVLGVGLLCPVAGVVLAFVPMETPALPAQTVSFQALVSSSSNQGEQ